MTLLKIADDDNQNITTCNEALALCRQMEQPEIAFLCNLWSTVLQRVQKTSIKLQEVDLDLSSVVELVRSFRDFIAGLRNQFHRFESAAQELSPRVKNSYKADTDREGWRKKASDESSEPEVGVTMTGRQKFVDVFFVIIDKRVAELDRRYGSYNALNSSFGFLSKIHIL